MKKLIAGFFKEEEGLATIEIVLILVVLAGLAFMFKGAVASFFSTIKTKIETQINQF